MLFCRFLYFTLAACCAVTGYAADEGDLSPFPVAEAGYDRLVIRLPPRADEQDLRFELLVGKEMESDCNASSFIGDITDQTVEGWGYSYYRLDHVAGPVSTLMACVPDSVKELRFVTVGDSNALRRYNSKLPIVIYVPTGFEARYRIWVPEETTRRAVKE